MVRRRDIPGLVDDECFASAWGAWRRWKRFGLAHGRGPAEERPAYLRAIEILEQEYDLYETSRLAKDDHDANND